jgi:hypothetical protein
MRLRGKSLTCIATLDDVHGVVEGQKPVEPRSKGLGDEGPTAGMMPAGSFMNILKKGNSVLGSQRWTMFVASWRAKSQ